MLTTDNSIIYAYKNPVRQVAATVAFYEDAALLASIDSGNSLKSFSIERTGENNKFFGFGIGHKANIKVIDTERTFPAKAGNRVVISTNTLKIAPTFTITQIHRDEITNELSITAYDAINDTNKHIAAELELEPPYNQLAVATKIAAFLNAGLLINSDTFYDELMYEEGANLEGTETLRQVLDALAEASQTIYYINSNDELVFKRLDRDGAALYTITKDEYFTLDSGDNRRLSRVCHTTVLGDNVEAKLPVSGTTQYMRDNPFLDLRGDIGPLMDAALERVGGLSINQFECEWRGNPVIEIGDKIGLVVKDDKAATSFLLDDLLEYDGSLRQRTQWRYEDTSDTDANPSSLGDYLNQTKATVDKVNQQIGLVASKTEGNTQELAQIQLTTNNIQAEVSRIETQTNDAIGELQEELTTLSKRVNASITAEDIQFLIETTLQNGIDKVITQTGYVFDENGLTISKSDSEMATQITEDGMTVSRNGQTVLTANNEGVIATNLHANTYLWIGKYSRFEDYEPSRTGCFWVGGD